MSKTVVHAEDLKKYELMVIIDPDIGENDIKKQLDKIRKQITGFDGQIFHEDLWALRNLAYSIKKRRQGYYAILDFMALPEFIREFDRVLRLETEILRHLITVLPKQYEPKDYMKEAAEAKAKEDAEKEEQALTGAKKMPMPTSMPMKKAETPVAAPAKKEVEPKAAVKEEAEEESSKKSMKKKEAPKQTLEDIDKALESIIDNPDIKL